MKIDSILNAAFKVDCTDIVVRGGRPLIGYKNDVQELVPGYEKVLTMVEVSEIISELIDYKNLSLGSIGLIFPYTSLEHSDYKVSILTPNHVHFARVRKQA